MPRSASSAAQEARERLASRLRDLRLDASLDVRHHAEQCGWSASKTSRIETGRTAPSDADIRAWCRTCDAVDRAPDLLADNRQVDQLYTEWRRHLIPFGADRGPMWHLETFYMFDSERVIVENLSAEINVTAPSEIALYERAFLALGSIAVYGGAARALVDRASGALG